MIGLGMRTATADYIYKDIVTGSGIAATILKNSSDH